MDKETGFLTSRNGLQLYYRYWEPETTSKVLCIVHGLGEHGDRYEHVAAHLYEQGIATWAIDLRGHGLSEGKRGHTPSYDLLMEDIAEFLKTTREHHNDLPLYLMGHSMGGNLVSNFMINDASKELSGYILSSPWFRLAVQPPSIKLKLGKIMAKLWPGYTESNGLATEHLSRDEKLVSWYENDPLIHDKISAGLFKYVSEAGELALKNASKIKTPGLVYHGSGDQIIDWNATHSFATQNEKIDWHLLEGVYHEPHNDIGKASVIEMISDWIKKN